MRGLQHLGGREASIVACLTDAVVAPGGELPAVCETDAVAAFDRVLGDAPAVNRLGIRAMLWAVELGPLLLGRGARLRRLDPVARTAALDAMDRHPVLGPALKAVRSLAHMSYYGDLAVLRGLGYDPVAVVDRGTALRAAEGRW